ncbi:MAG TPA: sulfotransferase [Rhizomicrobium sp.]|nr:sulfotransferase [Rhizomicrobium sp.]
MDGSANLEHAMTLHEAGRLADAERAYAAVLSGEPANVEALLRFGVLRLQQGHAEESLALTARALALDPQSAEALSNLATALHVMRRHEEAIGHYTKALAHDPEFAEAHYGLGTSLMALRRLEESVRAFERALAIDPDYVEALCGLGAALQDLKRPEPSSRAFLRAAALAPDLADAHHGLGLAWSALHRDEDAVASFGRAIALRPGSAEAHNHLGLALQKLDRYGEALASYDAALALRPDYAEVLVNRGKALAELGRGPEADEAFERAFRLDPAKPGSCHALAMARTVAPGDECVAALEKLLAGESALRPEERVLVHFALGKAYGDLGERDRGFEHILTANAIKRGLTPYDEKATLATIEAIGAAFTPEFVERLRGAGHPSGAPVFIVGMPRSGSTLTEQILASHPAVLARGERFDFAAAVRSAGLDATAADFPLRLRNIDRERLGAIGSDYVARISREAPAAARRITDKMLANFCAAGLIHLALPNARILHTRRDPVDTCLSCFSTMFEQPFAYDLGELGRYYRTYERLMDRWRSILPAGVMMDVQYEDVVGDLEGQARRIVAHCGLEWSDRCLSFHEAARPVKTASVNQVRRAIYKSSVGRWRPDAGVLRPLLEALSA